MEARLKDTMTKAEILKESIDYKYYNYIDYDNDVVYVYGNKYDILTENETSLLYRDENGFIQEIDKTHFMQIIYKEIEMDRTTYCEYLLDKLTDANYDNDIDAINSLTEQLENALPFKSEAEHQEWLDTLFGYRFYEDFENATMKIIEGDRYATNN